VKFVRAGKAAAESVLKSCDAGRGFDRGRDAIWRCEAEAGDGCARKRDKGHGGTRREKTQRRKTKWLVPGYSGQVVRRRSDLHSSVGIEIVTEASVGIELGSEAALDTTEVELDIAARRRCFPPQLASRA
jgi:hypothetical protein